MNVLKIKSVLDQSLKTGRIQLLRKLDNIGIENLERELTILRAKVIEAEAETLDLKLKIRTRQAEVLF